MKFFITGATGFVGGRVARLLIANGHEVVALVRDPNKARSLADLGVSLAPGDITNKASMVAPMTGADGVFHLAAWYKVGVRDKSPAQAINVSGTRNVLEVMHELGIGKGVYTSTLAVNSDTRGRIVDESYRFAGKHLSEYDRTKAEAHRVAESFAAAGLPLAILMPGLIYGPDDTSSVRTYLIQFIERKLPVAPQQTAFCWSHVDDIAQAHIAAMERGRSGETYIIGGPPHRFVEVMAMLEEICGIPAPRSLPPSVFRTLAAVMGVVEKVVPVPDDFSAEGLRVIAGVTYLGDSSKARRELGYTPRPLIEGLTETVHHELEQMGRPKPSGGGGG